MTEPVLIHRQREILRELARLTAERARIEPALSQGQREQLTVVETEYAASTASATDRFNAEKEVADRELEAARAGFEARAAQEQETATAAYTAAGEELNAAYETDKKDLKTSVADESMALNAHFEGEKGDAEGRVREKQGELGAWQEKIKDLRKQALAVLERWQQPAAYLDPPPPEPENDSSRLPTPAAMHARAEKYLKRLSNLRTPRYLAIKRLALIFVPLALLLTYPLGLVLVRVLEWGRGLVPVLGSGVIAGALVAALAAVITRFALVSRARAELKAAGDPLARTFTEAGEVCRKWGELINSRGKKEIHDARNRLAEKLNAAKAEAEKRWNERRERFERETASLEKRYRKNCDEINRRRVLDTRAAEQEHGRRSTANQQRFGTDTSGARAQRERRTNEIVSTTAGGFQTLAANWKKGLNAMLTAAADVRRQAERMFPSWNDPSWESWTPPPDIPDVMRMGDYDIREGTSTGSAGEVPHALPPAEFTLPALRAFPNQCSLLFKAEGEGRDRAAEAVCDAMFRLLTGVAPGKVRFTIFDPAGLGRNFATFMNLVDYDEQVVSSRIWTEAGHIDQRLSDLTAHIENVVQAYLRNRYADILEYNAQAGEVAEPFRVVVAANFPVNFNDEAARRLVSIARNGPRCGVFTLITVDTRQPMPHGFDLADLEANAIVFDWQDGRFVWRDPDFGRFPLRLEAPPAEEQVTNLLVKVGVAAAAAARVEVPFEFVTPPAQEWWTSDSRRGLNVPLGRAGALKRQALELGRGTSQHVLIAGKTGSGKSTLLHCLITNAALCYSPQELELYLIDFKKGVEFKAYATNALPHARVVAVESEREFGMSVLQRLDAELTRRGEIFRAAGAQNVADYRDATGKPMSRVLLIVDEFQEFFIEDDRLARDAAQLFDRLVRQGRAFGLHVILGSQSVGGAYSLARSTIDQMAVRVALQCSEADANLILSQDNSAARLLTRPGEAIYNDANGLVEGNNHFQVVWLSDDRKDDYLRKIRGRADGLPGPVVFEGNAPAEVTRNTDLGAWIAGGKVKIPTPAEPTTAWLGEAMALTGQTAVQFRRQNGSNLVIIGQNDESVGGILATAMISLVFQTPPEENSVPRFFLLDATQIDPAASVLAPTAAALGRTVRTAGWRQTAAILTELSAEVERRQLASEVDGPPIWFIVYGLHRSRDLRRADDDFGFMPKGDAPPSPPQQLATILREGPPLGVHTLFWCDTLVNLQRSVDRQMMRELSLRVALQMNASDSTNLIDSPQAGRLGSHRAFFFNEEEGRLEKFRPYSLPPADWLARVQRRLAGSLT
jgi:hypothetical protein